MRRQIRLTGRKQLPRSSVDIRMLSAKHSGKVKSLPVVGLTIVKPQFYDNFPRSARIRLRLIENKFAETLEFGTLGNPRVTVDLEHTAFRVPSCQLRIVASDLVRKGVFSEAPIRGICQPTTIVPNQLKTTRSFYFSLRTLASVLGNYTFAIVTTRLFM